MNRRRLPEPGVSHDPADAPHFLNKIFPVYWSHFRTKIIAVQDDDHSHYPFLKQWIGMEVDLENQFALNNGQLGAEIYLHNDGKHEIHYHFKMKTKEAEMILATKPPVIGVVTDQLKLIYVMNIITPHTLAEFLEIKRWGDKKVKKQNYGMSKKGWIIE